MAKKRGEMYKGEIKTTNNQKSFYKKASGKTKKEVKKKVKNFNEMNVLDKIDYILGLPKYLPKYEIEIKLKEKTIITKLKEKKAGKLIVENHEPVVIAEIIDLSFEN